MLSSANSRFKFTYSAVGKSGFLDQALAIKASGRALLAPTLRFTPLDRAGQPLTNVEVRTAYGSDEGRLIVVPRGDNIELLHFRGADAWRVADVRVTAHSTTMVDGKRHGIPRALQFDAHDREVQPGGGFDRVRIFNDDRTPMQLRAVMLVLEDATQPPQGVLEVIPLTPDVFIVPPRAHFRIDASADIRHMVERYRGRNFISVKAFPAAR